jgi:hypothetical protein
MDQYANLHRHLLASLLILAQEYLATEAFTDLFMQCVRVVFDHLLRNQLTLRHFAFISADIR